MLGRLPESLGLWQLLVELDAWKVLLTLLVSLERGKTYQIYAMFFVGFPPGSW